jgi:hypothetical protein
LSIDVSDRDRATGTKTKTEAEIIRERQQKLKPANWDSTQFNTLLSL